MNLVPTVTLIRTKELMLDAAGPCLALLHADADYVYLNTGRGLIRMTHEELRR